MRTSPRLVLGIAAAASAAALAPAIGQDRPESLLPPGLGQPAATPSPTPTEAIPRTPAVPPVAVPALPTVQPLPSPTASPTATPTPTIDPAIAAEYELPAFARRTLDRVGEGAGGVAPDAFRGANGIVAETLMRRLAAPLPSRWMSILLRRLLVSPLDTPRGVNGADFAAERAWLLLRMGEPVAARALIQSVDPDHATPKLRQVAMNAALATGDPAALCPLTARGATRADAAGWTLAGAMCAALAGDGAGANRALAAVRRSRDAAGIDLSLAQKVVGTVAQGRQAVVIDWAGVDRLTVWRFGLATATGVAIPDELFATTGPQVRLWQTLSPAVPLARRIGIADAAAAQGVLSNAALVDLYGAVAASDDDDIPSAVGALADDLRTAYTDPSADTRLAALRTLWTAGEGGSGYGRLILTAHAAARIAPGGAQGDADRLVAAMLSAGMDRTACRWLGRVAAGGDAWAMLHLANPDPAAAVGYRELSSYTGSGDAAAKQRLLFAGLAGLGRMSADDAQRAAEALDVRIGAANSWTRAIDRAANDGDAGTVVLLAALAMQTPGWRGVPPAMLYRLLGALRSVGFEGEARMIAAEAIARA